MRMAAMVLAAALAAPAWAVEIEITADPPLAELNLARNPGMEEGAAGEAAHWSFGTAVPENFETAWVEGEGRGGSHALYLKAHDSVMSGYWSQTVQVEPGRYVFRGYYRTTGGRLLMYAHGRNTEVEPPVGVDERTYAGSVIASFLVPVFIPYEALVGADPNTFYPFSVQVQVPERLPAIALSMGMYFSPGEAWFDDVWFGPAEFDLRVRVNAQGARIERVTVFDRDEEEPLYTSSEDAAYPAARPLPDPFEARIPRARNGRTYLAVARTADGELFRAYFPEEAQ